MSVASILRAELSVTCPRCKAEPGNRCVTPSGRAVAPHSARWRTIREAYYAGVEAGLGKAVSHPESAERELHWLRKKNTW